MSKKTKKEKCKKQSRSRPAKNISFESAIFFFAFLNAASDKAVIERAFRLALRGPDLLRAFLWSLAASQGHDLSHLMSGDNAAPATRTEVKELAEPLLKRAADMVTLAQIADIYLFGKERTPENLVYAFYTGMRFVIAGERTPTKEESAQIWEIALVIARSSKIGEPFWKEREAQGPHRLEDWIKERKEDARKKYKTFLGQKRRAEEAAQKAFESLMSDIFGDEDEETP